MLSEHGPQCGACREVRFEDISVSEPMYPGTQLN